MLVHSFSILIMSSPWKWEKDGMPEGWDSGVVPAFYTGEGSSRFFASLKYIIQNRAKHIDLPSRATAAGNVVQALLWPVRSMMGRHTICGLSQILTYTIL